MTITDVTIIRTAKTHGHEMDVYVAIKHSDGIVEYRWMPVSVYIDSLEGPLNLPYVDFDEINQ